jgi:S-formylglutathione hydrolase FrmB
MRHSLVVGTLLLSAACGGSTSTPTAPPVTPGGGSCTATPGVGLAVRSANGLTVTTVLPRSTDACITQALDSHFVVRAPAVAPVGRLLVFLPGTGAVPQNYQLILAQAALAGYHAIGLTYPNAQAVGVLCAAQAVSCYGATRLEILTGESASSVVDVARSNSIENRLVKLLAFMQTAEPAGNWRQFLNTDSTMAWSQVAVSGHSQGGGHALFIAQRHAVYRGSTYASAGDLLPNSATPAPWVTQPYATPTSRLAGFISTADELVAPTPTLATWASIGLAGAAVNVDVIPAPYGTGQRFVTSAAPANPLVAIGPNHNVVVVDANTPKVGPSSTPVFAAVWRAVSFP